MQCSKCKSKAIIKLQHGALCKAHFISYFEEKVFKTVNKYRLISRKDSLCIATSGGKDSLTVLYLTKKYLEKRSLPIDNLSALCIDEGIGEYREKTIEDLKKFCGEHKVPLTITSFKEELGKTLDNAFPIINKECKKRPCNICGVWRRYLLNKHARKLGATKVVTGHNLDDEAQAILMNLFKANTKLAGRLGPISGIREQQLFIQRVKPLYFCTEKEVRLYTLLKGFRVQYTECPYAEEGYRHEIQSLLNEFENKYHGTKQGIIKSFLDLLPLLKEKEQRRMQDEEIRKCSSCGEAVSKDLCNACKIKETLENAQH